jgi:hypothetical protein
MRGLIFENHASCKIVLLLDELNDDRYRCSVRLAHAVQDSYGKVDVIARLQRT